MRGHKSEITATSSPMGRFPNAVKLNILNDPTHEGDEHRNRGSGMFFRNHQEIRAAITELRAHLPVIDQLGSLADE